MKKEFALKHIEKNLNNGEELVGFFYAQKSFSFWLFFLIGPLAVFSMKSYFVGVSKLGIHFHQLNLMGKFKDHDFFQFSEITSAKIGKGLLQRPMNFLFKNGRSLKIKAQLKGVDKVAKLTEETQAEIEKNVNIIK